MIDSFIPLELAVAPNPLGLTSNLKLTAIPIDAYTCFELWLPSANATLMPEEAMLLLGDCSRLEEICAKLTHLLGGTVIQHEEPRFHRCVDHWQQVQELIHQLKMKVDTITVSYLPQAIYPNLGNDETPIGWTLRPTTWGISFLSLKPSPGGYRVEALPMSLSISMGQLVTKPIDKMTVTATYP